MRFLILSLYADIVFSSPKLHKFESSGTFVYPSINPCGTPDTKTFPSVSIGDFEQVDISWDLTGP